MGTAQSHAAPTWPVLPLGLPGGLGQQLNFRCSGPDCLLPQVPGLMTRCLITLWEGSQPWRYCKTPLSWRHGVSENPESILVTWGCSFFSVSSGHSCSSTLSPCLLAFSLPCWLQTPDPEENVVSSHAVFNKTYRAVLCSLCHQAAPHTVPAAVSFSRHCLRRGWIRMLSAPAAAT